MLKFYMLPEELQIALSILSALCVTISAFVFSTSRRRLRSRRSVYLETLVFFLVTLQTVLCSILIAQAQENIGGAFIVPGGYILARYILFSFICAVCASLYAKEKTPSFLLPIAASFLTLPIAETAAGNSFMLVFAAALLMWLGWGLRNAFILQTELKTSVSALSVKQAMDSLHTAILFCYPNGHILLRNHQMETLMRATAGKIYRSGTLYIKQVVVPGSAICRKDASGGENYLYHVDSGAENTVWLFTVREILIGRKTIIQLTATDVTEQEHAAALLREKHAELKAQEEQLKTLVANVEEIRRARALVSVKSEVHDSLGQELSLLLRSLRQNEWPDENVLSGIAENLLTAAHGEGVSPENPGEALAALADSYERCGVKIQISGDLPFEEDVALTLVRILREAAANAVTHGYANAVEAAITYHNGNVRMKITDSGAPPAKSFAEGGGIAGMRHRLKKHGGELTVSLLPRFTLTVSVPILRKEGAAP